MPDPVIESLAEEAARLRATLHALRREIRLARGGMVARLLATIDQAIARK